LWLEKEDFSLFFVFFALVRSPALPFFCPRLCVSRRHQALWCVSFLILKNAASAALFFSLAQSSFFQPFLHTVVGFLLYPVRWRRASYACWASRWACGGGLKEKNRFCF
jgi:hypothetical protein